MSKMTERAKAHRLPLKTTPEDLEMEFRFSTRPIKYGNKVLLAVHHYDHGSRWFGAIYEFLDDTATTCEDFIGICDFSNAAFEDEGHAIEWAIKNA